MAAHPAAALRSSWRETQFIEYYYVGIGGHCGMDQPIEQPDNNFIALRSVAGSRPGLGNLLYAEFQNGTDGNVGFAAPDHYELFDCDKDPWHTRNIFGEASAELKASLHKEVQAWLACRGASCG